jgi:hypothetical protein
MKRLALVLAIALVLIVGGVAYADSSSLVGQAVQGTFPVMVNGTQLAQQAIVINGVSYLPTRAVRQALGATVSFTGTEIDVATEGASQTSETVHAPAEDTGQTTTSAPGTITHLEVQFDGINSGVDPSNSYMAMNVNGQWYIALSAFGQFAAWNGQQATVSIPGHNTVTIPKNQVYQAGVDGFQSVGIIFVNTSSLGFTTTLNGSTLDFQ